MVIARASPLQNLYYKKLFLFNTFQKQVRDQNFRNKLLLQFQYNDDFYQFYSYQMQISEIF